MNSKVISFQIVQAAASARGATWNPDIIALCEDGSLWCMPLTKYEHTINGWTRLTPEQKTEYNLYDNGNGQLS